MEISLLWAGMCQTKSLSYPMTQQENKKLNEKRIHPTHKPIMLYDIIYQKFSTKGMKIIDTHLGGGSNRISADKNELNFWGWEIDKEYFDASNKGFNNYKLQLNLF
jgi:site-specific DNA-methyltransferase (adenine-specific)